MGSLRRQTAYYSSQPKRKGRTSALRVRREKAALFRGVKIPTRQLLQPEATRTHWIITLEARYNHGYT
jgi:hypothetical protein